MGRNQLKITFNNPNTEEETVEFLTKIIAEMLMRQTEQSPEGDKSPEKQQAG